MEDDTYGPRHHRLFVGRRKKAQDFPKRGLEEKAKGEDVCPLSCAEQKSGVSYA